MKTGEIAILIHHYMRTAPYPEPSPFYHKTIAKFRALGIISDTNNVTPKGHDLVERLKSIEP